MKVHYRTHKRPLPVPIRSQLKPFHVSIYHFLKIHLNIIFPSRTKSTQWLLSPMFPHPNPVYASPIPHTCYMSRQFHSSRFDRTTIWWGVQGIMFLVTQSSSFPCFLISLGPSSSPCSQKPQPLLLLHCERPIFTPIKKKQAKSHLIWVANWTTRPLALHWPSKENVMNKGKANALAPTTDLKVKTWLVF